MSRKELLCSFCHETFVGKVSKEYTTGIKSFTCSKCNSKNNIPLGKWGRVFNNIIMVIFGILSFIALTRTSWTSSGLEGSLGLLVGNSIIFVPFILALLSFLGHRKLGNKIVK